MKTIATNKHKIHLKNKYGRVSCHVDVYGLAPNLTDIESEVTCKSCLKFIKDRDCKNIYEVSYDSKSFSGECRAVKTVASPTRSSAIYKAFKMYVFDDDIGLSAKEWFWDFIKCSNPKVKKVKNKIVSLTLEQEKEKFLKELQEKANWWNEKYPVGSQVLFHRDARKVCEIRIIQAPIFIANESQLVIFMIGVSGYYQLSDDFVRPYQGNEHLLGKSLKNIGAVK